MSLFFQTINYWAILLSGIVYWLIGAVWFSMIFGKIWSAEIKKHGVKIEQPTQAEMISKFVATLFLNILVAFGVAIFVHISGIQTLKSAIGLGLILGGCFTAATLGCAYLWESRSLKLASIDIGYPMLGIIASTIIITLWRT